MSATTTSPPASDGAQPVPSTSDVLARIVEQHEHLAHLHSVISTSLAADQTALHEELDELRIGQAELAHEVITLDQRVADLEAKAEAAAESEAEHPGSDPGNAAKEHGA